MEGEEALEHAENQNERENLLRLFCRIFPFSPFEFPLLNGRRVWIAKALEVKSGFAILKQHWP